MSSIASLYSKYGINTCSLASASLLRLYHTPDRSRYLEIYENAEQQRTKTAINTKSAHCILKRIP